jgi:hypothetical protein
MRRVAIFWILLTSGFSIWWGSSVGPAMDKWVDFKHIYYGTRCLIQHRDPYKVSELESVYRAEGGELPSETIQAHQAVTIYRNLPATFIFTAPFAMLPWGPALLLWMTLTAGIFILAAFLMWDIGASYAPDISLFLICILLVNCEMIFGGGNTAGITVGLCVVSVWCFLQEKFVPAGILCLAISLAIKPHNAGLVWLYFLLAGGVYRKRALQTLIVTVVIAIAAILWVTSIAPHWMGELNSNMLATSVHGGINDPGPASASGRYAYMVIDLQAVISVFRDDPRIYDPVSYLVCGTLLLVWAARTLWARFSQRRAWLALAAIVPLTVLVTYHRPWDAKLLMLTVPACAMLWAEGGKIRWIALVVTTAGIVLTADIPLAILVIFTRDLSINIASLSGLILKAVLTRPTPLILLLMSIFYLWIYLRRDPERGLP